MGYARFLVLTNELPRLADASGALPSRFIALSLERSFYGREDQGLTDRLLADLPGILNWSLDGYRRLHQRGHFVQPEGSADAIAELEELASPVGAFVQDRCVIGPEFTVRRADLYSEWKKWCEEHGRDHCGNEASFGRDLRAVVPSLRSAQPRDGEERPRVYVGVGLRGPSYATF